MVAFDADDVMFVMGAARVLEKDVHVLWKDSLAAADVDAVGVVGAVGAGDIQDGIHSEPNA